MENYDERIRELTNHMMDPAAEVEALTQLSPDLTSIVFPAVAGIAGVVLGSLWNRKSAREMHRHERKAGQFNRDIQILERYASEIIDITARTKLHLDWNYTREGENSKELNTDQLGMLEVCYNLGERYKLDYSRTFDEWHLKILQARKKHHSILTDRRSD